MNFKLSPQPLDDNDPSSAAWGDWHTKLRFALNQSGLSFDDLTDVPPNLVAIAALTGTGFAVRTGSGTWALRDLIAGTGINITNPEGIAGDPTISNTGVTSIAGTALQITASAATGDVTLSLPSAVTLPGSLTVTTDLVVNGNTTLGNAGSDTIGVVGVIDITGGFLLDASAGVSGQVITSSGSGNTPAWTTLSGVAVTSITGTANQITASSPTGAVTLSLPSSVILPGSLQTTTTASIRSTLTDATLVVDRLGGGTLPALSAGTASVFIGNLAAASSNFISIHSGNAGSAGVNFGDTDADSRGYIRYNHSTEELQLGVAGINRLTFGGTSFNIIGNIAPDATGTRNIGTTSLEYNSFFVRSIERDSAGTLAIQADNAAGVITLATAGTVRQTISAAGNFTLAAPDSGNTLLVNQFDGASAIITSQALSGGLINWQIANTSNTASSDVRLRIISGGSSGGDAYIRLSISGVTDYVLGIDNSDTDSFVISRGTALGTTNAFRISNTGEVSIPAPTSGNTLNITQVANDANFGLIQSQSSSGITLNWSLANTSNTAGSDVVLNLAVGGGTASDPMLRFGVTGVVDYVMGIDNSDSDRFKIEYDASLLGSGQEAVGISTAGAVRFPAVSTTASAANAFLDSGASNNLLRSTSSIKFKRDIRDLTDQEAQMIYNMRPIMYKSKAKADDPNLEWYGLIAEELADIAPRLVHWNDKEPDGVQYERISVLMIHELKKMRAELDDLKRKMV